AGKAEVKRFTYLVGAETVELFSVEHLPKSASASAGRVLLLACDHEARAHDAAVGTAAIADPDAARRRVRERAVILREGEMRLDLRRLVVGTEAQVRRDRVRVDNLAGVQLPVRVPDRLELAEAFNQ